MQHTETEQHFDKLIESIFDGDIPPQKRRIELPPEPKPPAKRIVPLTPRSW